MKKKPQIQSPLEIVICIVDRGKGDKVMEILKMNGCMMQLITMGTGTAAKSNAGDFFGFGIIEREVVFALMNRNRIDETVKILTDILNLDKPHTGILTTLPISSATSTLLDMLGINY